MPLLTVEAPEYRIFEADWYEAKCTEVTIEQREPDMYHKKPYTNLCFKLALKVPDEIEMPPFRVWAEPKSGATGKLNQIAIAMGLPPFEPDEQLNTDIFLDRWLRINIDDKKKDGTPGNKVLSFGPMKKGKGKQATLVPDEQTDDSDDVPF